MAVPATPLLFILVIQNTNASLDWTQVDRILGRSGALQGNVCRVGFPRTDLQVRVGTVSLKPALALGSWVALQQTGDSQAMLMGDLHFWGEGDALALNQMNVKRS